jgi:AcrR family transcriptional regulator
MKARAAVKRPVAPTPSEPGLRARNKFENRQRIRAAARELFSKKGYEEATLRGIAERAKVGLGTLFNYAEDKRDLVFLIVNQELDQVTTESLEAAQLGRSFIDQLMAIGRCHYYYFAKNPVLSRILLQELVFYSSGKQAEAFHEIRRRLMDGIEKLVRSAQRKGQIRPGENPALIARHIFFTFSAAVRWWIANPRPNPRTGLEDLRRLFGLAIRGLQPGSRPGARKPNC